jgi:hypothetical protein
MKKIILLAAILLSGCASMTPTNENVKGFKIYDIPTTPSPLLSRDLAEKVKIAMQQYSSDVTINQKIPDHDLPEKASRYKVVNPLQNATGLMAFAAQSMNLEIPSCDGSVLDATSHRNYAGLENTTFFVCLIPYQKGYQMDVYYSYTKTSGGISMLSLSNAMAQQVVGDTSQFIPKTIVNLENSVTSEGLPLNKIDGYPN